ncbi:transcription termination/antitermination NusG family protein [Xanthobacteraceae bacterium Astr-EGSB]|uniref:transcription termination/antitermination protein NusG n=1 Tax=Astrobacterium formosum TaxID=3069710 RepID=UPI0027B657B3|nr:transcription termination/antitermination NusG family protein [Xanthobacteraceae bacterium Astr-EGSB]
MEHPLRWCVVYTGFHQEIVVRDAIARLGLEPFLPMERKQVIRKKRLSIKQRKDPANVDTSEKPLFSRYVLARIDLRCSTWKLLFSTPGVAGVVMSDGWPSRCPDEAVAELQEYVGVITPLRVLRPGDAVRIRRGPFGGLSAIIKGLDDSGRVSLLLDILGGQTRVVTTEDEVVVA